MLSCRVKSSPCRDVTYQLINLPKHDKKLSCPRYISCHLEMIVYLTTAKTWLNSCAL